MEKIQDCLQKSNSDKKVVLFTQTLKTMLHAADSKSRNAFARHATQKIIAYRHSFKENLNVVNSRASHYKKVKEILHTYKIIYVYYI